MEDDEAVRDLRRRARGRIRLPAKFLILMAAIGGGLGFTLLILACGLADGRQPPTAESAARRPYFWVIGLFAVAWCGTIGYGAWEMDRLGNYRAAKVAAWMALVPVPIPLYLLWMVGAFLGVMVLGDPAVRAAFASGNGDARARYLADNPYRPPRPRHRRPRGTADDPHDLD